MMNLIIGLLLPMILATGHAGLPGDISDTVTVLDSLKTSTDVSLTSFPADLISTQKPLDVPVSVPPNKTQIICDSSDMIDHRNLSPPQWLFVTLFGLLILTKTGIRLFPIITVYVPESLFFVALGVVVGVPIGVLSDHTIAFNHEQFFGLLLPIIVLEASYFVSNGCLYANLSKVLTFAVLGTLTNVLLQGFIMSFLKQYYSFQISELQIFIFATILSAVDPVAVICVFQDIGVNQVLYISVFGESLLNDGVTVVFYRLFVQIVSMGHDRLYFHIVLHAVLHFCWSAFVATIIGLIGAYTTGFVTKYTYGITIVQPFYCIFVPFGVYTIAESFHYSGIIAMMVNVIVMKPYTNVNLNVESKNLVNFMLKSLAAGTESYIFMFLGIGVFQLLRTADITFTLVALISTIVVRFIVVFAWGAFINIFAARPLSIVDLFIMAYGGLRGAVCFGLVMAVDAQESPCKRYFASTAIVIILFTIFIQGGTIKDLVVRLKVKTEASKNKDEITKFELVTTEAIYNITEAISLITGRSFFYNVMYQLRHYHDLYIAPIFTYNYNVNRNRSAFRLAEQNERIEMKEAAKSIAKFGSFAALPIQPDESPFGMRKVQSVSYQPSSNFETENPQRNHHVTINIPEAVEEENENELPPIDSSNDFTLLHNLINENRTVHTNLYSRYFTDDASPSRPTVFTLFGEDNTKAKTDRPKHNAYNTVAAPEHLGLQLRKKDPKNGNHTHRLSSIDWKGPNTSAGPSVSLEKGEKIKTKNYAHTAPSRPQFSMGDVDDDSHMPASSSHPTRRDPGTGSGPSYSTNGRFRVARKLTEKDDTESTSLIGDNSSEDKEHDN